MADGETPPVRQSPVSPQQGAVGVESVVVPSDADLVRLVQRGDVTSLGVLLERHRASLTALALGLLRDRADAQDAVQDAFLIALRRIGQLKEPEAVGAWLRAVVRNVCLSRLRERQAGSFRVELTERDGPREASAEEHLDRLALREWVWTALGRLPEPLRVTAMVRYFGTHSSYEEIAALLGVPTGTVRSRLNQVKVKLADALLATAELAHDDARLLADSQTRFFAKAHDELNNGHYELLASAFADDLVVGGEDSETGRGLEFLTHRVWDEQLAAGVKVHPTKILVSTDITVIEGVFENPQDDPFHCPPATSIVCFYGDGKIRKVRQYYSPRHVGSGERR